MVEELASFHASLVLPRTASLFQAGPQFLIFAGFQPFPYRLGDNVLSVTAFSRRLHLQCCIKFLVFEYYRHTLGHCDS